MLSCREIACVPGLPGVVGGDGLEPPTSSVLSSRNTPTRLTTSAPAMSCASSAFGTTTGKSSQSSSSSKPKNLTGLAGFANGVLLFASSPVRKLGEHGEEAPIAASAENDVLPVQIVASDQNGVVIFERTGFELAIHELENLIFEAIELADGFIAVRNASKSSGID
jgi:hypothetical protein